MVATKIDFGEAVRRLDIRAAQVHAMPPETAARLRKAAGYARLIVSADSRGRLAASAADGKARLLRRASVSQVDPGPAIAALEALFARTQGEWNDRTVSRLVEDTIRSAPAGHRSDLHRDFADLRHTLNFLALGEEAAAAIGGQRHAWEAEIEWGLTFNLFDRPTSDHLP